MTLYVVTNNNKRIIFRPATSAYEVCMGFTWFRVVHSYIAGIKQCLCQ